LALVGNDKDAKKSHYGNGCGQMANNCQYDHRI
jgi:hypothetical protein